MQFQQQFPLVQQPSFTAPPTTTAQLTTSMSQPQSPRVLPQQMPMLAMQQMQNLIQQNNGQPVEQGLQLQRQAVSQENTPIDITDKQVYLATPDGKMTAYKVVLHTGSAPIQQMTPTTDCTQQMTQYV